MICDDLCIIATRLDLERIWNAVRFMVEKELNWLYFEELDLWSSTFCLRLCVFLFKSSKECTLVITSGKAQNSGYPKR